MTIQTLTQTDAAINHFDFVRVNLMRFKDMVTRIARIRDHTVAARHHAIVPALKARFGVINAVVGRHKRRPCAARC
jgi:hypothetical protein